MTSDLSLKSSQTILGKVSKKKFKVLILNESGGPGGAERVVFSLAKGIKDKGIEVGVATLRTGWLTDKLNSEGITHHLIKSRKGKDLFLPFKIAKLIKKHKYSLIHSHLLDSNFYAALASKIALVPHLATEHGDVHHTKPRKFLKTKIKTVSLLGSNFSAVSGYTADKLIAAGANKKRVHVIGNPVFLEACDEEHERKAIRKKMHLGEDDFLWVNVANLRPVKDQATLIKGFADASSEGLKKQILAIIGNGAERANLERLSKSLDLDKKVFFAGHQEYVSRWLAAADGFILSSKSEAMPMALLEAAMSGLIIISSDVGGVGELIKNKQTGFLFESGNHKRLSKLIKLAAYGADTESLRMQCKNFVINNFSVEFIVEKYLQTYLKLLS